MRSNIDCALGEECTWYPMNTTYDRKYLPGSIVAVAFGWGSGCVGATANLVVNATYRLDRSPHSYSIDSQD